MAENDGKIYITITDKRGEGGSGVDDEPKDKEKEKGLGEYAKHQFFSFIKSQATQMVSYTMGNIGNFTGDFHAQRQTQLGMKCANMVKDLAMSFYGGMKLTGSVQGGLVALTIATAGIVVNTGLQTYAEIFENKRRNFEISQLRNISGLDTLTNGGR